MPLPQEILDSFNKAYTITYHENESERLKKFGEWKLKMNCSMDTPQFKDGVKEIHEQLFKKYGDDLWDRMKRAIPPQQIHVYHWETELKDFLFPRLNEYFNNVSESLKAYDLGTNEWFTNYYRSITQNLDFEIGIEVRRMEAETPTLIEKVKERLYQENQSTMNGKENVSSITQHITINGPAQIGNNNTQHIFNAIQTIEQAIDKSDKPPEEKSKAKNLLLGALECGGVVLEKTMAGNVVKSPTHFKDDYQFDEKLGIYTHKTKNGKFCSTCLLTGIESPLQVFESGWQCLLDKKHFFHNPNYVQPRVSYRSRSDWRLY